MCDEPVSALDVSIQSQVLNLLDDLQQELGLTYLFIAHNLAVVEHISDRVGVMYLGALAEIVDVDEIYAHPAHPYTVAILSAVPDPSPRHRKKRLILKGDIPSPANPPSGCRFHTRRWLRERLGNPERCVAETPELGDLGPGACCSMPPQGRGDRRDDRREHRVGRPDVVRLIEGSPAARRPYAFWCPGRPSSGGWASGVPSTCATKWHATSWPGETSTSAGATFSHSGGLPSRSRSQQRVWK